MREKTLLLVDDEPFILDTLSRDLREEHYNVTQAVCGEDAVAALQKDRFDFVITDLLMTGIDGFQVLKEAKKNDSEVIVIILTGYGNMVSAIDALRLGADDFLQKPCDSEELLYRMANSLERNELRRKVSMYERILPVCMYCKKIRDDRGKGHGHGTWCRMEEYFHKAQGIDFSHGCCPECYDKTMGDLLDKMQKRKG